MSLSAKALFSMPCLHSRIAEALDFIDEAISTYPEVIYPCITGFEVGETEGNVRTMRKYFELMSHKVKNEESQFHVSLIQMMAVLAACEEGIDAGILVLNTRLKHMTRISAQERGR